MDPKDSATIHHFLVIYDHLGKRTIPLSAESYIIGRDPRCSILLHSMAVSRQHAQLIKVPTPSGDFFYRLIDGNIGGHRSTNGVSVNDHSCTTYDLHNGDRIQFGSQVSALYIVNELEPTTNLTANVTLSMHHQTEIELQRRDRLLNDVIAARDLRFPERLQKLLSMGCEWFELEQGYFCEWNEERPNILAQESQPLNGSQASEPIATHKLLQDALFVELCTLTVKHDSPLDYDHINLHHPTSNAQTGPESLFQCRAWLGVRVLVGKQVQGLLCFTSSLPVTKPFERYQKDLLRFMAQWVGSEMERQQYQNALQNQLKQTVLLKQITQKIRESLDTRLIFQTTVEQMGKVFRASRCLLHTYAESPQPQIPCVSEYLAEGIASLGDTSIPINDNPHALTVLSQDAAVVVHDITTDPLLEPMQHLGEALGIKSMIAVRTSYQGKPNGVLALQQCDRQRYWQVDEIELFEAVAAQVGIAIAQAQLLEQETEHRNQLMQQNQALAEAKQAAEEASRAKSEFLAIMSHEIRTPMNAVIGTLDLLHSSSVDSTQATYLDIARNGSESLMMLLNDILDFSKIESGKLQMEMRPFDLHHCVGSVLALLAPKCAEKHLELKHRIEPNVPLSIEGDSHRLRQVLVNLISNAIKFTPAGQVCVYVGAKQPDPTVEHYELLFMVRDTGIGISKSQQELLFQPFSQVDSSVTRQYGGTGLGLAICKQLVNLMGGKLWVESRGSIKGDCPSNWSPSGWVDLNDESQDPSQVGSTFYAVIPVNALEQSIEAHMVTSPGQFNIAPTAPARATQDGATPASSFLKVLLVEDNPVNQTVAQSMLKQLGYTTTVANHGLEALQALQQENYDLVLMDIEMPEMDGITTAQHISRDWQPPERPYIIALTAYAMPGDRERCLQAGMQDYITKPLRIQELKAA
ncbi:MAG TPA: response regulator, partial [Stenomitos sp.]